MPIYEFKCIDCNNFTEVLIMNKEKIELKCISCGSKALERIVSRTNHSMSNTKFNKTHCETKKTRTCSNGSCTTYNIPGPV